MRIGRGKWIGAALALVGLMLAGTGSARAADAGITDEQVSEAIERGRAFLIGQQNADGSFGKNKEYGESLSALVFMTLAYMGEHPNREAMSKGMDFLLALNPDTDFGGRAGYAVPIRIMGLSYVHNKLLGEKRTLVRQKMMEDVLRLQLGQNPNGGWRYRLDPTEGFDFSVTQWPILAMREAGLVGIEFSEEPLKPAWNLYKRSQHEDGGWAYQEGGDSYGSMTAAGLASVFILSDFLEPASGCPCKGGRSQPSGLETERRIDSALEWLSKNFDATTNPRKGNWHLYWLYCVERVGIAAGYKYFGQHNWYKEGAEFLLRHQQANGSWKSVEDTCFALLFLYKGRAPVLFNKLRFDGVWNAHRRDIANLTEFVRRTKEQMFHWQIVELTAPVEELHDAPILYASAESIPKWTDQQKQKLRAFTDTGGTLLFEASCGNPTVRRWFKQLAKELWPEWRLTPLKKDHALWKSWYSMKQRPEVQGIDDGVRTFAFFCMDDVSCPWHMKAYATRAYLFKWGINLYTYATDGAPLRAKLAGRGPASSYKYSGPVRAGPHQTLRIARVRHAGNWSVGVNYGGFQTLAERLKEKADVTLDILEAHQPPAGQIKEEEEPEAEEDALGEGEEAEETEEAEAGEGEAEEEIALPERIPLHNLGVAPGDLAGHDVAYLTGSRSFALSPQEREALKKFVQDGGFLWVEAATGSMDFDQSTRQFVEEMGWKMDLLPKSHSLMTGRMDPATGYNLTSKVKFRRELRVQRLPSPYAELLGLFDGNRLIGLYSPYDVMFSLTGYEAYKCRGYATEDAAAVATNIALFLTTRKAP